MFANNSYVTIWDIKKVEPNYIDAQISTSRKVNGTYEQDFGGIVRFVGEAKTVVENKKPKDRVKILECGVSNKYNKEKKTTYWNLVVFKCEDANNNNTSQPAKKQETAESNDMDMMNSDLPF